MNNSDLSLSIVFDLGQTDPVCTFNDITNYAIPPSGTGAVNPNYITTYLEVSTPQGVVQNSLNSTALLGSPDIFPFLGQSYKDIVLPVDSDGKVPAGSYSFRMQSRVWSGAQGVSIVSASNAGSFVLAGDVGAQITALIGRYFIVDAGVNEGVFTVVSATYDPMSMNTLVIVDEDVENDAVGGDVFIYFTGYTDYTSAYSTQYFNFTEPVVSITVSASCKLAKITAVDFSTYAALNAGLSYQSINTDRQLTLTAPVNPDGSGFSPTATTTANSSIELTNIYTGNWVAGVYTQLAYTLSSWFSVICVVQEAETIDVQCDDCACTYYTCIKNLWDRYYTALTTNITRANTIRSIIIEVNHAWMLYQMSSQCGYDTTPYCTKIKDLAQADDCICTSGSGISIPVVAWGSSVGSGSTSGASWHNDSGVPSQLLGATGDYYLDDDTGDYYKKVSGSWVLQGNLKGSSSTWHNGITTPAGTLGSVGDYYIDTVTKEYFQKTGVVTWTSLGYLLTLFKIHEDLNDDGLIATVNPQVLKTFTLPANTLLNLGDEVIIEGVFEMAQIAGASDLTIAINLGTGSMYSGVWTSPQNPTSLKTYSKFSIVDPNTLKGSYQHTITDIAPSEVYANELSTVVVTLTNAQAIEVLCQSSNGVLNDIICRGLSIYILKQ